MANAFPCPNPICTHQFGSAELQTAAQLLCPKCGFRMQGKVKAAPVSAKPAVAPAATATNPCPNPTCTYQFNIAELQTTAQLLCPKCGFRMQGKAAPKPAASVKLEIAPSATAIAAPTIAKVAVAMPISTPAEPGAAIFAAVVSPPSAAPEALATETVAGPPTGPAIRSFFNPDNEAGALVRTSTVKKKFRWLRILMLVFAFGFAACIVIVAIGMVYLGLKSQKAFLGAGEDNEEITHIVYVRDTKGGQEKAYQLVLGKKEWSVDTEIGPRFGASSAWKNNTYDVWFAVVVKDYGVVKPRDAEMLRVAIDKLEGHFEALELGAKAEPVKANNLFMQKLPFKGQVKAGNWLGECYMFFNNGIAYWLFVSSPDWERVEEFAGFLTQKNLGVLSERRGWHEQPPPTETFTSANIKVSVTVPKGVWEKHNAKDEDENGELLLLGRYQKEKDNRKNALMLIYTHEKKDNLKDALKGVREYLDKKLKNENENYRLVHAVELAKGDSVEGKLEDVGDRRGQLVDVKLQINDEPKRYILLAVIREPDIVYAIQCSCPWESRHIWRQEFLEVLRSVRVRKD